MVCALFPNGFRIEKMRLLRGKFDKGSVQDLINTSQIPGVNYLAHLSDYGSEQNILLPSNMPKLHCHIYFNIQGYLMDIVGGFFTFDGRRFNAASAFERVKLHPDMQFFASVFKVVDNLADFWKVFNFNILHNKFQLLRDFSQNAMLGEEIFEDLFHFANLMLILQVSYESNFQQLTNQQLIELLNSIIVRVEAFDFLNKILSHLYRLREMFGGSPHCSS